MKVYNEQTLEKYKIDWDTSNTSFLKMAALLYNEGISNCTFFLRLDDIKLSGVDPYDPKLSDEMKMRIFKESSVNKWYFYREVFRVLEPGASTEIGGGTEFKLNRGNLAYLWACSLNISCYMILPRQTGKTWAAIADCAWTHQFVRGSGILHFNKNQGDANMNLRRMQDAIRMLPMYLQHSNYDNLDPRDKRRVKNNEKSIRNAIDATIEAMASAGNEAKADALARGKTASKVWFDELAFIFFNEAIYTAATPAFEKAREVAMRNEVPFNITITTTPGDLATPHGAFAYKMMNDSIRFDEHMYDMKRKKLFDVVYHTPDKTDFVFIQFNHLQLGETDEWYLERAKKMNNPIKARREYLLEWINSNGNSPFDPDDIELIGDLSNQKLTDRKVYKINKYYELTVYSEYHGKKPVLISVDVSGGLGRDSTAVVVVNPETLIPMAFFKSNMIPSDHLKKLLVTLVTKRYPHCIMTIENNSVGKPLLDELRDTPIAKCLYKEKKKRNVDVGNTNFTKTRKLATVEYGHNVNPTTRGQMMEMLENIVHNSPAHVAFPELYNEIKFLELRNGRIDHSSATHDDCTMAYMGALWIVRYGTGLKGKQIYYTIATGDDDESYQYDTTETKRIANKLLSKRHLKFSDDEETYVDDGSDELIAYMRSEHEIYDSGTLAEKERKEYYAESDRIEGVDTFSDDDYVDNAISKIPDSTQRLMLKNYYAMMGIANQDDPYRNLLDPDQLEDRNSLISSYFW